jgi:predicted DsbA family dithiol-disulfide isomerase
MSAKNLSTVASDLITSYGNTAKNVIDAYRAGGERVVSLLEQRWNHALKASRTQLAAETVKNASAAQLAFSVYYTKGLTLTANGAEQVVSQLVKVAEAGIERAAANTSLFEEKTGVNTLNTLAQAAAPAALILSKVATQLEQKTAGLASRIAGDDAVHAGAKRKSAFSQRRATKAA